LNDDKMDVGEDVAIKQPSPSDSAALSCSAVFAPRLTQSPESISEGEVEYPASNNIPLSETNSLNSYPPSPNSDTPSTSTECDPGDDDPPSTSDISIDGWDSDLSDLSDTSTDEDEDDTDSEPISVRVSTLSYPNPRLN
jgi:hypothetical protein